MIVEVDWSDLKKIRRALEIELGEAITHERFLDGLECFVDSRTGKHAKFKNFWRELCVSSD